MPAHGYEAVYSRQTEDGELEVTRPVIAWHAGTGWALVLDPDEHKLAPAQQLAGFKSVRETPPPATYVPGGGWMSNYLTADGQQHTAPVVAWWLRGDGRVDPVVYYDSDPDEEATKIWHPDQVAM